MATRNGGSVELVVPLQLSTPFELVGLTSHTAPLLVLHEDDYLDHPTHLVLSP